VLALLYPAQKSAELKRHLGTLPSLLLGILRGYPNRIFVSLIRLPSQGDLGHGASGEGRFFYMSEGYGKVRFSDGGRG